MKLRLRLKNKTDVDSKGLRRLILACMREAGVSRLEVTVKPRPRATWIGGMAWFRTCSIHLTIPVARRYDITGRAAAERVAQVVMHEIHHTLGNRHEDMPRSYDLDVSWLPADCLLSRRQKPERLRGEAARVATIAQRAERSRSAVADIEALIEQCRERIERVRVLEERRLKRYRRKLTEARRRARYYEQHPALAAAHPPDSGMGDE